MKKVILATLAFVALIVGAVVYPPVRALATTYGAVLLNDGTETWAWTATIGGQLGLGVAGGATVLTLDQTGGPIPPITVVASLPTCNSARKGAISVVTDASSPSFNATLSGSSTTIVGALCNGTNWVAW